MKTLHEQGQLLKEINGRISRASQFYVATALVTQSGLDLVSRSIQRCLEKGGKGYFLFGVDLPSEPLAIQRLTAIEKEHKESFTLRRFESGRTFFHPKLSIFISKTRTAIVGSSNLTAGGLNANYEANVLIDQSPTVDRLLDYFNEHFLGGHSKRINQRWLAEYEEVWKERKQVEKQQRKLREKTRHLGGSPVDVPKQIKGHMFAFTGAIYGWPRKRKLYPRVIKLGGTIAKKAGSMGLAECLVHGDIMGGHKSTQKLSVARQRKIPVITEDEFFKLARIHQ